MYGLAHKTRGFPELFDEFFTDWFTSYEHSQKYALIEWDKDEKEATITIEAPGFSKEDIKIESDSKGLKISGEISDETLKNKLSNRKFSYILRRTDLDPKSVQAILENGILEIKLKKEKDKKVKIIEIQ